MGDRANTILWSKNENGSVDLSPAIYTHWSGELNNAISELKKYYKSNKNVDTNWNPKYRLEVARVFPIFVKILNDMGLEPQVEMYDFRKDGLKLPTANDMHSIADDRGLYLIEIPSFNVENSEYKYDQRLELECRLNLLFEPNEVGFSTIKDELTDFDLEHNLPILKKLLRGEIETWLSDLGIEVKFEIIKGYKGYRDITDTISKEVETN